MEDLRTTLEHAAMPVLTVVVAALGAGAEAIAVGAAATAAGAAAIAAGAMRPSVHFGRFPFAILAVLLLAMPCATSCAALSKFFGQTTFSSPEEGMQAFVEAIKLNDSSGLKKLLGADGLKLFDSGDAAADA